MVEVVADIPVCYGSLWGDCLQARVCFDQSDGRIEAWIGNPIEPGFAIIVFEIFL
ncbi:hypothetical protein D3C81_1890510 [compost metagenome]